MKQIILTEKKMYEFIGQNVGEEVLPIIKFLRNKKNISEFKIAEKTKTEVNAVRNVLYRLQNYNLVSYYRKKDREKGWYISYWTFNKKKVKELMDRIKKESLERYRERLNDEQSNMNAFFICPKACTRLDFHGAVERDFKCAECGSILQQHESERTIAFLKEKIREIEATA